MRYQDSAVSPVAGRINADAFANGLAAVARRLLFSTRTGDADREFLHDVARGRYPMKAAQRLTAIAALSTRPEDREAFAELVRTQALVGVAGVQDFSLALDLETQANGPADVAARDYERHPSRATWERALVAHEAQGYATRCVLDALQRRRW